jgi:uncharacterized membrane protein YkvA (DUF1232 family)
LVIVVVFAAIGFIDNCFVIVVVAAITTTSPTTTQYDHEVVLAQSPHTARGRHHLGM